MVTLNQTVIQDCFPHEISNPIAKHKNGEADYLLAAASPKYQTPMFLS